VQHIVVDEYGALLERWGQREVEILGENSSRPLQISMDWTGIEPYPQWKETGY